MDKNAWRNYGKAARQSIPANERTYEEVFLTRAIASDPRWRRAEVVLLFQSFGSEWCTDALIRHAWSEGKTVALPLCRPEHEMMPVHYTSQTPLVETLGKLKEIPFEAASPIAIEAIDFCLIPGLLFDPYGNRLGYGAGYYDRFLPKLSASCTLLAAGFNCQLVGKLLPSEKTDFFIPEVLTPSAHILTHPFHQ